MNKVRRFLAVLITLALFSAAAVSAAENLTEITLGIIPTESSSGAMKGFEPFRADMEKALGIPVKLFIAPDYAGVIEARVTLLNPKAMGLQIHVLLSVSMVEHSDRIRKAFETHVEGLPEVMTCFSVSGERDYVLQIISKDMESYNQFLNTKILHHSSVRSASSSFALRRVKYTTELPF